MLHLQVGMTGWAVADSTFPYTAPLGTRVHLAFVSDAGVTSLYADGVFQGTIGATIPLPIHALGADNSGDTTTALIDELAVYNRALSPTEIQAIVTAGSAGKCP